MSISAHPITPGPIFLFAFVISPIISRGYLLRSIILSRKCTAFHVVSLSFFQSISPFPFSSILTILARLIEPKLQDSYCNRGCSPHGLVDSISPRAGVGLEALILSKKTIPGSPFFHAWFTIVSKTVLALRVLLTFRVLGFTRSY